MNRKNKKSCEVVCGGGIIPQNLLYSLPVICQSGLELIEFLSRLLGVTYGKMGNR